LKLTGIRVKKRAPLAFAGRLFLIAFGVITLWVFFYMVGKGLLALPASFHEGSVWKTGMWDDG
jgi:hypothetical protein